jgi:hypothetical protein
LANEADLRHSVIRFVIDGLYADRVSID